MRKTILTLILSSALFLCGAIAENAYLTTSFKDFDERLEIVYLKCDDQSADLNDLISLRTFWIKKKESLHSIIPHTEIKEIDLWVSEAVRLVDQKKYDEAMQKIEVVRQLSSQVPKTFRLKFENIF